MGANIDLPARPASIDQAKGYFTVPKTVTAKNAKSVLAMCMHSEDKKEQALETYDQWYSKLRTTYKAKK